MVSLSTSRRKRILLIALLVVVVLGALGAIVFLFPQKKEYIVLREIPITTYYLRSGTYATTLSRTILSSLASSYTVTKETFIPTVTVTRYDPRTLSWTATTTDTVATVIGNTTYTMLVRTLVYTYVFTTSVPATYVLGIPTVTTETTARWTSFNTTTVLTTTITFTTTSASTYTWTVWTTLTTPPKAPIISPPALNQARALAELVLCSALVAGILVFRKRSFLSSA